MLSEATGLSSARRTLGPKSGQFINFLVVRVLCATHFLPSSPQAITTAVSIWWYVSTPLPVHTYPEPIETSQKISVLQHAPSTHLPARPGDPKPTQRNLDPLMHPFARARERTRALNAAKMERMFAKPFVAALEGHQDAIEVLAKRPESVTDVASGSWDGGTPESIS